MNKFIKFSIAVVALILLTMPLVVSAANVTSYTSGFQVQNLSLTEDANVVISFYNRSDGSLATTQPATIPKSGSTTFFPLSAVAVGFDGSVVISSDQPVAAIANILGNGTEHAASYGGLSVGADTVSIPLIQKNNFGINSFFNIQNTGSANATVNITYPGTACQDNAAIQPGAAVRFDQSTDTCLPDPVGDAGYTGSAIITSDQPVVATVMQVQSDNQYLNAALLAYNGFTGDSIKPVMPLVSSGWYGSVTGIQIQNTGSQPTNATLTYSPSSGFPGAQCTETKNIPAGQSTTFGLSAGNLLPAACRTLDGGTGFTAFVGSAAVTTNSANQPLVAIVNQINSGNSQAAAYAAFDPALGTQNVSLPLVADRNFGIFSGFSIANVGSGPADITCTFTNTPFVDSATGIQPGQAFTSLQLNKIADKYVGSATCTSNQNLVAIVNYLDPGTVTGALDGLSVYEGINIP